MRLTWRDGLTTLMAFLVILVALAAIQGWGWPLLGSDRSAMVVLGVLGYGMCHAAGTPNAYLSLKGGYRTLTSALGAIALIVFIVGMIWPSETWIVLLSADILLLWVMATVRHGMRPAFAA